MDLNTLKVGDIVEIDGQKRIVAAVAGAGNCSFAPYHEEKGVSKIIDGLEEVAVPKKKRGK